MQGLREGPVESAAAQPLRLWVCAGESAAGLSRGICAAVSLTVAERGAGDWVSTWRRGQDTASLGLNKEGHSDACDSVGGPGGTAQGVSWA